MDPLCWHCSCLTQSRDLAARELEGQGREANGAQAVHRGELPLEEGGDASDA